MKNRSLTIGFAIAAVVCASAGAQVPARLLGEPSAPGSAERTVVIGPATRYVNVTEGDVVRFVVNGRSFVFDFDSHAVDSFALDRVAPPGLLDHTVTVYVARNVDTEG
jgi:hypothetical protein